MPVYNVNNKSNITYNCDKFLDIFIKVAQELSHNSLMGINLKRHFETIKNENLIIDSEGNVVTSYYFPEHFKTIIRIKKNSVDITDSLLLIHEMGHSYFNQYYKYDFYSKSNLLLNEVLAHFTQILFGRTLIESNIINAEEKTLFRFYYLYRLHQCIFSSFGTHYVESLFIDEIQKRGHINTDDFLNIRKKENRLIPNLKFNNAYYSKLNILVYEPFATGIFNIIPNSLSFSLALSLYETFKSNLDLLDSKLKLLFSEHKIDLNTLCNIVFEMPYNDDFIYNMLENIEKHLDNL